MFSKIIIFIIILVILYYYFNKQKNFEYFNNNPKVLYIVGVENSIRNVDLMRNNFKIIGNINDIQWCFLHVDGNNSLWKKENWYNNIPNKYKFIGKGCKMEQWKKIKPSFVKNYDYLWFSDGDIGLEKFNWKIYKKMLITYKPLLSQPSMLPKFKGGRGSDHKYLNWRKDKTIQKIHHIEIGTPFISTKIWPIIYEKIKLTDRRSVWETEKFFNKVSKDCGKDKYLNHLSPVIHYDFKNLQKDKSLDCRRKLFISSEPYHYSLKINNIIDDLLNS